MEKMGNRTVTQSEESITLVTAYRFPYHRYRFFTDDPDDALRKSSTSLDKRLPDKREHPANYTAFINTPF